MEIRKSTMDDMETILEIYETARNFMEEHDNPDQWGNGYPKKEMIENDIKKGSSYVCTEKDCITAVFYFAKEEDPSYQTITGGSWLNQEPYGVVHRIASAQSGKGCASFCLEWCKGQCNNLRIDTHQANKPMQKFLQKHDFVPCGTIYVEDGTPRTAYQWTNH